MKRIIPLILLLLLKFGLSAQETYLGIAPSWHFSPGYQVELQDRSVYNIKSHHNYGISVLVEKPVRKKLSVRPSAGFSKNTFLGMYFTSTEEIDEKLGFNYPFEIKGRSLDIELTTLNLSAGLKYRLNKEEDLQYGIEIMPQLNLPVGKYQFAATRNWN